MTPTERLILENQIVIMKALREIRDVSKSPMFDIITVQKQQVLTYLNESDPDGGH